MHQISPSLHNLSLKKRSLAFHQMDCSARAMLHNLLMKAFKSANSRVSVKDKGQMIVLTATEMFTTGYNSNVTVEVLCSYHCFRRHGTNKPIIQWRMLQTSIEYSRLHNCWRKLASENCCQSIIGQFQICAPYQSYVSGWQYNSFDHSCSVQLRINFCSP